MTLLLLRGLMRSIILLTASLLLLLLHLLPLLLSSPLPLDQSAVVLHVRRGDEGLVSAEDTVATLERLVLAQLDDVVLRVVVGIDIETAITTEVHETRILTVLHFVTAYLLPSYATLYACLQQPAL